MADKGVEINKLGRYPSLFKKYMTKMSSLFSSHAGADVYEQLKNGKTSFLRYERTESSSFDMSWIKEIEDIIFDLGEIVKNPKKTTKVEETIVPAELARKTNATSVRHLASHTQFIKEIDEKGNVTPSKILNIGSEDEYITYENRFVATLIRKLVLFIEKRYEYINEFAELKDAEVLMIKNKSYVDGKEVEIETKVRILSDNDTTGTGSNSVYINRIKEIRRYVRFYYNSTFMKIFKNERDVRNPIIMTNILRKNPLYRHCYELYKFIEGYDTLGVNFKINEKYSDFSAEEMEEINATLLANFLSCKGKDPEKGYLKNKTKQYKPKVLTSIDDEEFVYSKLLRGPVEFVRVDDEYLEYLQARRSNIPERPKKEEKEFYKEELKKLEEKKQIEKATRALLARKKKQEKEWNKEAERLVAKRLKEEEEARIKAEREAREQELARIAAAREELKREAKSDNSEFKSLTNEPQNVNPLDEALKALKSEDEEVEEQQPVEDYETVVDEAIEEPVDESEQQEAPIEENEEVSQEEITEEESELKVEEPSEEPGIEEIIAPVEVSSNDDLTEEVNENDQVETDEEIPEEVIQEEPVENDSAENNETPIVPSEAEEVETIDQNGEPTSVEEEPQEEIVSKMEQIDDESVSEVEQINEPVPNNDETQEEPIAEDISEEEKQKELEAALKALTSQAEEDFAEDEASIEEEQNPQEELIETDDIEPEERTETVQEEAISENEVEQEEVEAIEEPVTEEVESPIVEEAEGEIIVPEQQIEVEESKEEIEEPQEDESKEESEDEKSIEESEENDQEDEIEEEDEGEEKPAFHYRSSRKGHVHHEKKKFEHFGRRRKKIKRK